MHQPSALLSPHMESQRKLASSSKLSKSCILMIVIAGVERFAYKGVASNLLSFLTKVVGQSTSSAAKNVNLWSGFNSMLPLLTAVLVDSFWDRYSTIISFSFLYLAGLAGLTSWVLLCAWMPTWTLFIPLQLISMGQSGYNPSLQAFGADQLHEEEEVEDDDDGGEKTKFFQWWYFGICGGSLLSYSIMPYVQDNYGWGLGFAIPTTAMAASVLFFAGVARFCVRKRLALSTSKNFVESAMRSFKEAIGRLAGAGGGKRPLSAQAAASAKSAELELQGKSFREEFDVQELKAEPPAPETVAGVILSLLPIWSALLMFAVIFQQPTTFFMKQGMTMDRDVGGGFLVPPAMLQSSITLSILLLMPLYDKLLLLLPTNFGGGNNNSNQVLLPRIGVGMVLSVVAMAVAALVESVRQRHEAAQQRLSILWLLPQYVVLGVSDVFTVVGMQEFFYSQVPATMRTIGMALHLSVFGVGSFVSIVLISVVEFATTGGGRRGNGGGWFSDNLEEARLDYYYWVLAILSSLSLALFVSASSSYTRKRLLLLRTSGARQY